MSSPHTHNPYSCVLNRNGSSSGTPSTAGSTPATPRHADDMVVSQPPSYTLRQPSFAQSSAVSECGSSVGEHSSMHSTPMMRPVPAPVECQRRASSVSSVNSTPIPTATVWNLSGRVWNYVTYDEIFASASPLTTIFAVTPRPLTLEVHIKMLPASWNLLCENQEEALFKLTALFDQINNGARLVEATELKYIPHKTTGAPMNSAFNLIIRAVSYEAIAAVLAADKCIAFDAEGAWIAKTDEEKIAMAQELRSARSLDMAERHETTNGLPSKPFVMELGKKVTLDAKEAILRSAESVGISLPQLRMSVEHLNNSGSRTHQQFVRHGNYHNRNKRPQQQYNQPQYQLPQQAQQYPQQHFPHQQQHIHTGPASFAPQQYTPVAFYPAPQAAPMVSTYAPHMKW